MITLLFILLCVLLVLDALSTYIGIRYLRCREQAWTLMYKPIKMLGLSLALLLKVVTGYGGVYLVWLFRDRLGGLLTLAGLLLGYLFICFNNFRQIYKEQRR